MRKRVCIAFAAVIAIAAIGLAGPVKAQPYGSGMMGGGWGYGDYGVFPMMILWVLILIAVVAGIAWLARNAMGSGMQGMQGAPGAAAQRSAGLAVLEERYARGEIKREEYLEKKGDILG